MVCLILGFEKFHIVFVLLVFLRGLIIETIVKRERKKIFDIAMIYIYLSVSLRIPHNFQTNLKGCSKI